MLNLNKPRLRSPQSNLNANRIFSITFGYVAQTPVVAVLTGDMCINQTLIVFF